MRWGERRRETMDELKAKRDIIDDIDHQMAVLFEKRMTTIRDIARFKASNGMPVLDQGREDSVIRKNSPYIEDADIRAFYVNYMHSTMDISRRFMSNVISGMKIAYSGVEGAFAYIAAKKIFPGGNLISFKNFGDAYKAVESGECDCCVLPIENSYTGEVGQVIDIAFSGDLYINGVYSLPVNHNLLGIKGANLGNIRKVISHPQALEQCGEYISKNGFEIEEAGNTAYAAQKVAELNDGSLAAIASAETAELYGLDILDHDINVSNVNTTRFAVFSRTTGQSVDNKNNFILLFTVNDEVGALAKAVNIICSHGFNMRVLRSRPVKDTPWQYYFYVEAQGDQRSEEGVRMLKELSVCCARLKVVGHYAEEINLHKSGNLA